jgi:hypothetical protein
MGHSPINVSLTYLKGLEVPELKEEDMPMVWSIKIAFSTLNFSSLAIIQSGILTLNFCIIFIFPHYAQRFA